MEASTINTFTKNILFTSLYINKQTNGNDTFQASFSSLIDTADQLMVLLSTVYKNEPTKQFTESKTSLMTRTVSGSTYTEYTGHQGEPESLTSHMTSQPDILNDETKASSSSSSSSSSDSSEAEESEVPDAIIPPPEPPVVEEVVEADDFEADLDSMEAKLKSNLVNTDFSGSSILRQVEGNVTDDTTET